MLARRIIPCLDVKDGRVVKGVQFENIRDAGDPVALAERYSAEGADELVLLDISASREGRRTFFDIIERVARAVQIPFTVGGGISTVDEVASALAAGADKVSFNTAAVLRPELLSEAAARVGSQAVVAAIDARRRRPGDPEAGWDVWIRGGSQPTELEAVEWARRAVGLGAGELLATSMDRDGMQAGYDLELLRALSRAVNVPVIASGGAGSVGHVADAFLQGNADAVLAASIFHDGTVTLRELKQGLAALGIPMRLQ
ncbi:MAG: imidazole glycerol phosphate synthase subunit HisF [Bacteroidetes bacterium]|nr:imidazole glycerol phosphate synthase subunit HisF [Bacteroidota bacterium]